MTDLQPKIERFGSMGPAPLVSVVVLNRNGVGWLPKSFESIRRQTIFSQTETILVDNDSSDDSVKVARELLSSFPSATIVRNPVGLGYCGGNNSGAAVARGEFALFVNNDAWLEPDCLECLVNETRKWGAAAASPWVLNYADNTHQDLGFFGFDIFGLPSPSSPAKQPREIFIASGAAYFINLEIFRRVGLFDSEFFMYSDDVDLSWRVWLAGHSIIGVPAAKVHHRSVTTVSPTGGVKRVEFRSNDEKRFLSNRNGLLTLMKDSSHVLLLLVPLQAILICFESLVGILLFRRFSFFTRTCLAAFRDCWRLRKHVAAERRRIAAFRKHGDFWVLRFLRLRPNRVDEVRRILQLGMPKVEPE